MNQPVPPRRSPRVAEYQARLRSQSDDSTEDLEGGSPALRQEPRATVPKKSATPAKHKPKDHDPIADAMRRYQEQVEQNREKEQAMLEQVFRLAAKKNQRPAGRCIRQHRSEWDGASNEQGSCNICHLDSSIHWRCQYCKALVCRTFSQPGRTIRLLSTVANAAALNKRGTAEQNSSVGTSPESAIPTNQPSERREVVIVDLRADYESDTEEKASVINSWDKEVRDQLTAVITQRRRENPQLNALFYRFDDGKATPDQVSYLQDYVIELRKSLKPASQLATPPDTPPQKQGNFGVQKNISEGTSKKRAATIIDLSDDEEPLAKRHRPLQSSKALQQRLKFLPPQTPGSRRKSDATLQLMATPKVFPFGSGLVDPEDEPIVPNARIKKMVTPTRPHFHFGAARLQKEASSS
ncbi:hypothetical protein H2201_003631 [Coniosporium apollinis]|uniref:Uncharacterized protein n=2 Tax=Coniosporium TaxID=2810619 RepID=A0ABQ9NUX2_9PEZI|nr:hypothetical protein H2199_002829 [Cladosporium sp. JES 115]KAJ9666197.1 hypothetical protein H2201_003631 [Coniosporium apollinis]